MAERPEDQDIDWLDDDDTEEDEFERAIADCHMTFNRKTGKPEGCGKAGSEECDFECPYGNLA